MIRKKQKKFIWVDGLAKKSLQILMCWKEQIPFFSKLQSFLHNILSSK
jgi:hypothetical protein